MRRDWDVIRKILLQIEELPRGDALVSNEINDVNNDVAAYHMEILIAAGLIEGVSSHPADAPRAQAMAITWEGHEFLDKIRQDTNWSRVKEVAGTKGVELSFDTIKTIAKYLLTQLFN